MLIIKDDEIIRIPDPSEKKKKAPKKEVTFRVICSNCDRNSVIKQDKVLLRSKYGFPANSFYCPYCNRRNFFFPEQYSSNLHKEITETK